MAKTDLHVHSKYSDHPSTWGHKVYNSPESFTQVETVYRQAKRRGMDFVTLTDHDDIRGSLELVQTFPYDTFMSCEVTTFFPEDGCKAHVLVYGLNADQYHDIMRIRFNIHALRDYLVNQNLAYSVAHATYDQDGKLTFEHIEKLVLLFDVFEVINGGSAALNNQLLHRYLQQLTPAKLAKLEQQHGITPISQDPWVKGFTGGSDDHCGILIGSAYTQSDSATPAEFLQTLKDKNTLPHGMHGSFEAYATGVIKHVHDYRLHRDGKYTKTKMNDFFDLFFNGKEGSLMQRFKKSQSLRFLKKKNNKTHQALYALLQQISDDAERDMARKIPNAYVHINELHDEMFRSVVTALTKHLPNGDIFKGMQKLATLFPMTLLAAPFIGSIKHQTLKSEIKRRLINDAHQPYTEKALWFTDTIDDLNGVSVTLRQMATHSVRHGYQLKLVTCVNVAKLSQPLPSNTLNLPPVKEVSVPGYEQQAVGFPSLLSLMRKISLEQPDQIIISTPGPLGLGALLCAKLMDVPVKMVYHTDFAEQIVRMTQEPTVAMWADTLVNLFYKQADQVFVPSHAYIEALEAAGLAPYKLSIFPRGLDLNIYSPQENVEQASEPNAVVDVVQSKIDTQALHGDFTLMFAGRLSEDKNLSLLTRTVFELEQAHKGRFNLVIAGDGPDLDALKHTLSSVKNIHFTGRLAPEALVDWYRAADLFVFPSHTDTFGMVILEAQACGLPCLVTRSGGPKEIIDDGKTGQVLHTDDAQEWAQAILYYRDLKRSQPELFGQLQRACREHVSQHNNWTSVFEAVLGHRCRLPNSESNSESNSNSGPTPNRPSALDTDKPSQTVQPLQAA